MFYELLSAANVILNGRNINRIYLDEISKIKYLNGVEYCFS